MAVVSGPTRKGPLSPQEAHTLELLVPEGTIDIESWDELMETFTENLKQFWSKDGKTKAFREVVANQKKFAAKLEKDHKAWEKATQKRAASRSKLHSVDQGTEVAGVAIDQTRKAIEDNKFENINVTQKVAEYPGKAWIHTDMKEAIGKLAALPTLATQIKWSCTRMGKAQEETMVSEITNKKLLQDICETFGGLDSTVVCDPKLFFAKFPADHAELKRMITQQQVQVWEADYIGVSITTFCLPEVLVCLSGGAHFVGLRAESLQPEAMQHKLDAVGEMSFGELAAKSKDSGFAVAVQPGEILAIPAGMVVVAIGCPGSHTAWIRWSPMRGADLGPVLSVLTGMMQSFAYLESSDYGTLKSLLDATAESEAAAAKKKKKNDV
jgi:hypothetical protein